MYTAIYKSHIQEVSGQGPETEIISQKSPEPLTFVNQSFAVLTIENCSSSSIVITNCQIGRLIITNCQIRNKIEVNKCKITHIDMHANMASCIELDMNDGLESLQVENNECQLIFKDQSNSFSTVSINSSHSTRLRSVIDTSVFTKSI